MSDHPLDDVAAFAGLDVRPKPQGVVAHHVQHPLHVFFNAFRVDQQRRGTDALSTWGHIPRHDGIGAHL